MDSVITFEKVRTVDRNYRATYLPILQGQI